MKTDLKTWRIPLSIGFFVLGLLIAFQFKQQKREGFPLAAYRPSDLVRLLRDSEHSKGQLQSQIEDLRTRLSEYESAKSGPDKTRVLAHELRKTQLEAGLLPVNGPGIEVILEDSKKKPTLNEDPYFYLVHDVDLDQLTNELWAIGAEAVSINGERIVAGSAIRCVGPSILVNTRRLSPPYRVEAIGDSDTLYGGLKMRGGFLDAMSVSRNHGVMVLIAKKDKLNLPAYRGPMVFHYARASRTRA